MEKTMVFAQAALASPWLHGFALLLMCGAYLQGAFDKARDFPSAVAEMRHFGLAPAAPFAVLVIVFEVVASVMVISGVYRWLGALMLAGFTAMASFKADRFWAIHGKKRRPAANAFFEHWGLVGGFLLVAWADLGGLQHVG